MHHSRNETFSRNCAQLSIWTALALLAVSAGTMLAQVPSAAEQPGQPLPQGAGRDITHKVCGATCHGTDIIMGRGRSRDQWTAVVNAMVARGAKASDAEWLRYCWWLLSRASP